MPTTAWACTLGSPCWRATSPTRERTSTCSSTGMGRYCLDSHSKKPSVARLNAPMAVKWAAVNPCSRAKACSPDITSSPVSKMTA